jgi:hypothetical protein
MTFEQLEAEYAALPKPADLPNTQWVQEQASERERWFTRRILIARTALRDIVELDPQIAGLTKQHEALSSIRKELCDELMTNPPHSRNPTEMAKLRGDQVGVLILDGASTFITRATLQTCRCSQSCANADCRCPRGIRARVHSMETSHD